MSDSRTQLTFGVVDKPFVPILIKTTFIFRFMKSIDQAERKLVPYHSPAVLTLMADMPKIETCKVAWDIHEIIDENLALLVKVTRSEPKTDYGCRTSSAKENV